MNSFIICYVIGYIGALAWYSGSRYHYVRLRRGGGTSFVLLSAIWGGLIFSLPIFGLYSIWSSY